MSDDKGGRPAIGPKVPINFPAGLLRDIDSAADTAGLSRAAWVRRATARACPETFEGAILPDQMGRYLRGSAMGEDLDNPDRAVHVDAETTQRILRAVDDGDLDIGMVETKSTSRETKGVRLSLSFITRELTVGREHITLYQVTYTTVSLPHIGEAEGVYHHQRTLYLDGAAAEVFHEEMRETHLS
jgi:hypothetical protein